MTVEMWLTLGVLVVLVVVLVREVVPPAAGVLGALVVLVLLGVVDPATGFAGFSNTATLTVAGLFVVARAVEDHAGLEAMLSRLLGDGRHLRRTLAVLLLPTALTSAVIANTPLVAGLAPMVRNWAERTGESPSRYLMPLSFAAILGGTLTLIGTSTTLVVSGLLERSTGTGLGFLEITPVGIPVVLLGLTALLLFGPRLLPQRATTEQHVVAHERDYTFRLEVEPAGPVDGRTIGGAGLRNLENVYLASVHRAGHRISPVGPGMVLEGGDELVFVGQVHHVQGLARTRPGLRHVAEDHVTMLDSDRHGLHEAVIGRSSRLVGRSPKEVSFRGRYDAAIVAIHRAGTRVEDKLGTVRLEAGDSLLLQAGRDFADRWRQHDDFAVVVPLDEHLTEPSPRQPFVVAVTLGMVAVAAVGVVSIFVAVLAACLVLVGTRTLTFFRAKDAVDVDIVLIVAGAIGVGAALEASGLAALLADGLVAVGQLAGGVGALAAILVGTLVLTELVTNVAAAALMLPIALQVAGQVGADPRGYAVAVAVAASASFLTPIGYQTNTIVYGLAGYRFTDYWRVGAPVTLAVVLVALVTIPLVWG